MERERKFEVTGDDPEKIFERIASWNSIGGEYLLSGTETYTQRDVYADTPGRALHDTGCSYRVREKKGSLTGTFKRSIEGVEKREEIEAEIAEEDIGAYLDGDREVLDIPPVNAVRDEIGDAPLERSVEITNRRTKILLQHTDREDCELELVLDRVTYGNGKEFFGVEVELVEEATEDDLETVRRILERACPQLERDALSKYERGLRYRDSLESSHSSV